ncbi:hypothetical protein KC368_g14 [Hortaea werneckii]|nr:hypothetical protein KC368_g14 [Hortaea werneckii]
MLKPASQHIRVIFDGSSGSSCTGNEVTNVANSKAKHKDQRQSESKVMVKKDVILLITSMNTEGLLLGECKASVSMSHGLSWNTFHVSF